MGRETPSGPWSAIIMGGHDGVWPFISAFVLDDVWPFVTKRWTDPVAPAVVYRRAHNSFGEGLKMSKIDVGMMMASLGQG